MLKKFDEHCENLFFLKSEIMFCFLENENFEKHFENLCSVKSEIIIYIFSGKGAVSIWIAYRQSHCKKRLHSFGHRSSISFLKLN